MSAAKDKKDKAVKKSADKPEKDTRKHDAASKTIVIKPRVSEKAYALSEAHNTYVFQVSNKDNVLSIGKAVEAQYGVNVIKVRVAANPGKPKRSVRKQGRASYKSQRSGIRKAYVTLGEGDSLPIFAAAEEAAANREVK
jgi:ribosomal protein L23